MADQFSSRLSDYLDDELTPGERLDVEHHLLDCAACRAELESLGRLVTDARALADTAPVRDLWPEVRAALPIQTRRRSIMLSIPQAMAAGILLAMVSGLCVWLFLDRQQQTSPSPMASTPAVSAVPAAVTTSYDRAVDDLKRMLNEERSRLSPKTIDALERNLATIDRAIAEASAALSQDPSDPFLNSHLAQQRRAKLALLRQATQRARAGL